MLIIPYPFSYGLQFILVEVRVMPFIRIRAFFNPEQFQGWKKQKNYFEGWYFKIVNKDESQAFAFIPGVAMDEIGNRHSFVQVLDGKKKTAEYHKYDFGKFHPQTGKFQVQVGENRFSESNMKVELEGVKGELNFENNVPWPKPIYSPGIMGPYAFVPFMECYHGIVSMDHSITGHLNILGEKIDFSGGRGYIEKDWGQSFPSAYIWMQSNHFSNPGISIKTSIAKIPWLSGSFVGFIAGLWHNDRLIRFTTYNRSRLIKSFADREKVEIEMENRKFLLEIYIRRDSATELVSPILGLMDGRIEESMTSIINVNLTDKRSGKIILNDSGRNGAVEVAGNVREIFI